MALRRDSDWNFPPAPWLLKQEKSIKGNSQLWWGRKTSVTCLWGSKPTPCPLWVHGGKKKVRVPGKGWEAAERRDLSIRMGCRMTGFQGLRCSRHSINFLNKKFPIMQYWKYFFTFFSSLAEMRPISVCTEVFFLLLTWCSSPANEEVRLRRSYSYWHYHPSLPFKKQRRWLIPCITVWPLDKGQPFMYTYDYYPTGPSKDLSIFVF